ncbi:MAG: adenylate/guanylate cyclase domain-containing protein, partial [Deltaproteobacteria bacterium]|nr:adenylate/guanylate cyclase domain-containing protein [Deltaproteobacteria bacterium]
MPDDANKTPLKPLPENDLDSFLEKKEEMDNLFKEKFTRRVTVMFTDLKGSTSVADREGDLSSRLLIKHHNDIIFPLIGRFNGVLVKTMGDGTLSYIESAQDGVRAARDILKEIDGYNVTKKTSTPILMRVGLHT